MEEMKGAPAPVLAGMYIELRSEDGAGDRVHNVLRVDWEVLGEPQSIEEMQAALRDGGAEKMERARAAREPAP